MFDEQPDGDPHGECAAEIHRLQAENEKFREMFKDLMSVRDRFAMAAMQALLAAGHDKPMRGYEGWREEFMAESYRWADTAMAVRCNPGVVATEAPSMLDALQQADAFLALLRGLFLSNAPQLATESDRRRLFEECVRIRTLIAATAGVMGLDQC